MDNRYISAELNIIEFENEDVLTASIPSQGENDTQYLS